MDGDGKSAASPPEVRRGRGAAARRRAIAFVAGLWLASGAASLAARFARPVLFPAFVVLVLSVGWHAWAFGRWAGLGAAAGCAGLAWLACPQVGLAVVPGAAVGLVGLAVFCAEMGRRWSEQRAGLDEATRAGARAREELQAAEARCADLQRRLTEAERLAAVGTMSAQIAHQLRNPLTSVQLYVQLLEEDLRRAGASAPEEAFELVELVLKELRVLVEITDNYLRYARLPEVERAPLDVNRAVGELVRFLRPEVTRRGIHVHTRFAESLPVVQADRRLVRLAMINILKNALEAMEDGGRLRVATAHENGAVEVRVSDTGAGISSEELERIFEPFYTTKDSGSGLGLSLSRQIIEKHGGSLACHSMVGVGTTFVVKLPVKG